MPIANCIISSDFSQPVDGLVQSWSDESGIPSKHMTINIITSTQQVGNKYAMMASLTLPSMWNKADISSLQVGLAVALSKTFSIRLKQVHVVTRIIDSGMVVENGDEINW